MSAIIRIWALVVSALALASVLGCSSIGPQVDNRFTVFTPEFADNRVYHLGNLNPTSKRHSLESATTTSVNDANVVPVNSPLSIIIRSVEIPAAIDPNGKKGVISKSADYAVILDIGTNKDGSSSSMVVWYQRGVQPDQSLNFSNLVVFYESAWDERIAPFFRIRVMDVTKEKNAETRKALERTGRLANSLGMMATNPIVTPLIGISLTAADLVLANDSNKMLLDYSVQLYSSAQANQAGSQLGLLKRGSYIVVGRPVDEGKTFWKKSLTYDPESRIVFAGENRSNVPTASLTVGAFDSVVPKLVMERSIALTLLLSENSGSTTVENIEDASKRLSASIEAFAATERIYKYRNYNDVNSILNKLSSDKEFRDRLSSEDVYFILKRISDCMGGAVYASVEDAKAARDAGPSEPCVARK